MEERRRLRAVRYNLIAERLRRRWMTKMKINRRKTKHTKDRMRKGARRAVDGSRAKKSSPLKVNSPPKRSCTLESPVVAQEGDLPKCDYGKGHKTHNPSNSQWQSLAVTGSDRSPSKGTLPYKRSVRHSSSQSINHDSRAAVRTRERKQDDTSDRVQNMWIEEI